MDLGLSGYRLGMGWLAQALNAKWAQFSVNVLTGDEVAFERAATEEVPALVADLDRAGCAPILDAYSTLPELARIVTQHADPAAWNAAVGVYIERTMRVLSANPSIRELEVWGSADIPVIVGGRGPQFDSATILARVCEEVHAACPGVRVLSGGYGIDADVTFLLLGLCEHAPEGFDVYNQCPFPRPQENLESMLEVYKYRLPEGRRLLDERCKGQPQVSTCFGVPTLDGRPEPGHRYGTHWQLPGGVRAIDYAEADEWYRAILGLLEAEGLEYVCLKAQDETRGGLYRDWKDAAGLLTPEGQAKSFVGRLSSWAQERAPYQMEEEVITGGA